MPRRRRIRRKKVEEPVEEEVIEEEEELEEELDDLEDDDDDDDDDDEYDDDDEEYEDEDEEELEPEPPPKPTKPAPKKVKKPVAKKKPAPKPKAKPEPEEEVIEVKKVDTVIAEEVLTGLLDAMDDGQSIIITKVSGKQWQISSGQAAAVAAGPKFKGKEFDIEVQTPEYREWQEDWSTLTYAEKKKEAKRLKVKWESHNDARVDNIRISAAVRASLGIEKYKPEYRTQAARNAVKG
jgi:hypothetical protein